MSNPTFGYLASLTPTANSKTVLHTAEAGKLVEGKLTITHKNPFPTRVRVGVGLGMVTNFDPSSYIFTIISLVKVRVMRLIPFFMQTNKI